MPTFAHRSYELEHIDTGNYTPEEYEGCLSELQRVNRWLGDARALRQTLLRDLARRGVTDFSVLDVGAGSGELLRITAQWARCSNKKAQLVGLEYNARSAREIGAASAEFPEIYGVRGDAFALPFADASFDEVMCSLFTHHFREPDIVRILHEMARVARRGVWVIDLHRHRVAYGLYTTAARLILHNRLVREDGALSILRGFRPDELQELGANAGLTQVSVTRHAPFRLVLHGQATPR